tara:strand:+ start:16115 stop:16417 length:303 start_codon:yes stop_codon:yes gene_type:complete
MLVAEKCDYFPEEPADPPEPLEPVGLALAFGVSFFLSLATVSVPVPDDPPEPPEPPDPVEPEEELLAFVFFGLDLGLLAADPEEPDEPDEPDEPFEPAEP